MHSIMHFLKLKPVDTPIPPFVVGKSYMYDYFTEGERLAAKSLVNAVSVRRTWSLVEQYFEHDL